MTDLTSFEVWSAMFQFGLIAIILLFSNMLRRKIPILRRSLLPTAVIAGALTLGVKYVGVAFSVELFNKNFMEAITYHTLGLGFIALCLKNEPKNEMVEKGDVVKSSMVVVSTYLLQGAIGIGITILLSYTIMPDLFKAGGLLLALGFGQGPGQALNFGNIYEGLGFSGGASYGLSIAAMGFVFACLGGVIYLNFLQRKGKVKRADRSTYDMESTPKDTPNEIPVAEAVDKFTIQVAIVLSVYLAVYLFTKGVSLLCELTPAEGFLNKTVVPMLWGFNFLIGTLFAMLTKKILKNLRKSKLMNREYTNVFMLNRIAGLVFDIMIVTSIGAIEIEGLKGLLLPFCLICIIGGVATFWYVHKVCVTVFPKYPYEASVSMFGMLTGTASTGMILLREIDPEFKTPASSNLVLQSAPSIIFGFPLLILLGIAPQSDLMAILTFVILTVAYLGFACFLLRKQLNARLKKGKNKENQT